MMKNLKQSIKKIVMPLYFTAVTMSGIKPEDIQTEVDTGLAELTIDENGDFLKRVRREAGSDVTHVSERQSDGSILNYSKVYDLAEDGTWKKRVNPQTVYQFGV